MNEITEKLDTKGLNCPLPILRTKKALGKLALNDLLEVTSSDPGAVKDLASFCSQTGQEFLSSTHNNNDYIFIIKNLN